MVGFPGRDRRFRADLGVLDEPRVHRVHPPRERAAQTSPRHTPVPVVYLCGIVGNVIVVAVILTTLLVGLGVIAYGVTFPGRYLALILAIVVGAFCVSALGIAVSTFVPNEDAAPAIINFVLFPLLFISGTLGPVSSTSTLGRVAVVFPVRHLVQAMVHVFNPFGGGTGILATHTLMLLGWGRRRSRGLAPPLPLGTPYQGIAARLACPS